MTKQWLHNAKEDRKKIHHKSRKPESGTGDLFNLDKLEVHLRAGPKAQEKKGSTQQGTPVTNQPYTTGLPTRAVLQLTQNGKWARWVPLKGIHYSHQFYPGILLLRMVTGNSFIYILIYLIHPSSVLQLGSQEMNRNLNAKKFKLCQQWQIRTKKLSQKDQAFY